MMQKKVRRIRLNNKKKKYKKKFVELNGHLGPIKITN